MKYSKYQLDIFEEIKSGVGNLLVEACAGSGKTTTLINALNNINENKKVLFCAFNTDIVKELEKKIGKKENVEISTIHSLGRKIIRTNLRKDIELNEYKYNLQLYREIDNYCEKYQNINKKNVHNINKLISLMRSNLVCDEEGGIDIMKKYGIVCNRSELRVAIDMIEWGMNNTDVIDYTDMIFLPNILNMQPWKCQYDYVFVDEAQDLSAAQLATVLKCQKINTRYIFVGDPNQAIYGFSGSDAESFEKIKNLPNMKLMPLSISYRCGKNIVKLAQTIVPSIQYEESNIDGEVKYDADLNEIKDGDMIICRNNAPLMDIYYNLIRQGKKCYVKGSGIDEDENGFGNNLIKLIESTNIESLNISLQEDGVFMRLCTKLAQLRDRMMAEYDIDEDIALGTIPCTNLIDKINTLKIIGENFNTASELKEEIKKIFNNQNEEGISLSTVHKSKGLEADNVYIAFPSLMPSKTATKKWEIAQEYNLKYVAITRAKKTLGFIKEDKDSPFLKKNFLFKLKGNDSVLKTIQQEKLQTETVKDFEKKEIKSLKSIKSTKKETNLLSFGNKTVKLKKI
jgi:superfamily I DNA/RNA helicase